jgi:hypothetical protein
MKSTEKVQAIKKLGEIDKLFESAYNILHTANSILPNRESVELRNIQNLVEGDFDYQQKLKRYCDVINAFSSGIERQLLKK